RAGARPALPVAEALGRASLSRARRAPGADPRARPARACVRVLGRGGAGLGDRRAVPVLDRLLQTGRNGRGERGAARPGQPERRGVPDGNASRRPLRPAACRRQRRDDRGRRAGGVERPAPARLTRGGSMLIATTNDIAGHRIDEVYGEVFGLTVRSRNIGSQIGAGLKSILGGELKGMTKALVDSRQQVIDRMVAEAEAKGANAIVGMRFDTSEMGSNWTEICA